MFCSPSTSDSEGTALAGGHDQRDKLDWWGVGGSYKSGMEVIWGGWGVFNLAKKNKLHFKPKGISLTSQNSILKTYRGL